jgi:membrane protein
MIITEIRNRLLSFAIVLAVGFFLVVSLAANAWVSAAGAYFSSLLPAPEWLLQFINSTASFLVVAFLFAVLYKTLPAVPLEWADVAVGSLATSALFALGKFLISLYLGRSTVASAYGAAGSLVVFLLWVYYSAQVFFLGAEFTYVYTCRYGSRFRRKLENTPAHENVTLETPGPRPVEKPELVVVEPVKSRKGSVGQ